MGDAVGYIVVVESAVGGGVRVALTRCDEPTWQLLQQRYDFPVHCREWEASCSPASG